MTGLLYAGVAAGAYIGWHVKLAHRSVQDARSTWRTYRGAVAARRHHVIRAAVIVVISVLVLAVLLPG